MTFLLVALALIATYPVLVAAQAARAGRRGGLRDRAGAVVDVVGAVVAVVLVRVLAPWDLVAPALWALPVAATAFTALMSALAWRSLPTTAGRHRRWQLVSTALQVTVAVVLVGILLG